MARVVLLTGSNMGDKASLLEEACKSIGIRIGTVVQKSRIYESEPWGFSADETFLNQAIISETTLSPLAVLDEAQTIERELGRVHSEICEKAEERTYESRPIDIDILFYDDLILNSERLTIPHPRIAEREFVLNPLGELIPDYVHPVHRKTIKELSEQH